MRQPWWNLIFQQLQQMETLKVNSITAHFASPHFLHQQKIKLLESVFPQISK